MCGRYTLHGPPSRLGERFALADCPAFAPRYNIAPTSAVLVIRQRAGVGRVAQTVRWGLVPAWAKDPAIGARLNNARAETVADKPAFRASFARHRCLIPASGFYEWQAVEDGGRVRKQPWYIHPRGDDYFAFAGLLAAWKSPDGSDLVSTCVITTAANDLMAPIHERMPVILPESAWDEWLAAGPADTGALRARLVPAPATAMAAHPVATTVNRAAVDGPELILPLNAPPRHD